MNFGKVFEKDFKDSIPNNVYWYRLTDSASSFSGGKVTRFSVKNPFDFLLFYDGILMPMELKTTEENTFNFETEANEKSSKKIKYHQVMGLLEATKNHKKVRGGFLLQFRNKDLGSVRTYWLSIGDYLRMIEKVSQKKKSFNEEDVKEFNGYSVFSKLKKTHYVYEIKELIQYISLLDKMGIGKKKSYSLKEYKEVPNEEKILINIEALKERGVLNKNGEWQKDNV